MNWGKDNYSDKSRMNFKNLTFQEFFCHNGSDFQSEVNPSAA
jgi:hypothetical protein